jgi:hypothetical protein
MQLDLPKQTPMIRRAAGYVFAALILFFLGRVLYQSQSDLAAQRIEFRVDWIGMILALALQVIGQTLSVEAWRRLLLELDGRIAFRDAFRIWFYSNLARYVPGNIWQPATMALIAERHGVSKAKTVLSQALFIALMLAVAGVLSVALLPLAANVRAALMAACAIAVLFFAAPPVLRGALRVAARLLRYEPPQIRPSFWRGLTPLFVATLMWLANGLSFYFFTRALGVTGEPSWTTAVSLYTGAYLIGYVSFLTPSGIGVREGALAFFLGAYIPAPNAIALGLLARLLALAGELMCVAAAWMDATRAASSSR